MPYYRVVSESGRIQADARQRIAEAITDLHIEHAGGLRQFVTVVFEDYLSGNAFKDGKAASPVLVGGTIRAGRTDEQKAAILHALADAVKAHSDVGDLELILAVEEVQARNAMEGGHVMPEPGEEQDWLAKVKHLLA